jgi:parallel beta-helix repeat protein
MVQHNSTEVATMMTKKIILRIAYITAVAILAATVWTSVGWAESYYVDNRNGNDSRDGRSQSTAWKSLAKVSKSSFSPGDNILLKAGGVWEETLRLTSSGESGNPISVGTYGIGGKPKIGGSNNEYGIVIDDLTGYLVIDNIEITDVKSQGIRLYSWSTKIDNITIRNCRVLSNGHGIYLNVNNGSFHNLVIENCDVIPGSNGWANGINFERGVSGFTISNNNIGPAGEDAILIWNSDNGVISDNIMGGNYENSIDIKNSHHITISRNTCIDDKNANIIVHEIFPGESHAPNDMSYRIIIEHNKLSGAGLLGFETTFSVWLYNVDDSEIRYNLIEGAQTSGVYINDAESSLNNNKIYGNIIINNGWGGFGAGISIGDGVGTKIFNNLVYNQKNNGHGIYVVGGVNTRNIEVKNNIVDSVEGDLLHVNSQGLSNFIADNNCFHADKQNKFYWDSTHFSDFKEWQAVSGQDAKSIWMDPSFKDASIKDFHLEADSACIDGGVEAGLTRDFDGILIPQGSAPDIGPFEYKPSGDAGIPDSPSNLRIIF